MRFLYFLCPLVLMSGQVIISPQQPSVTAGKSITLTSNTPVTWALNGRGTLSNVTSTSATFTAPTGIVAKNQMLGCQVGPNDSIFNTRIDSLPVNSQSSAWIGSSTSNPTFFETDNWGVSIADDTTPTKTMRTYYSDGTIPNFVMPTGPNLKRQGGTHVGVFGLPSPPDHHILTVKHTDCTFYESYDDYIDGYTRACRDGSAGCNVQSALTYGAMNYAVGSPDSGTNAGGLPLAPTTWHLSEIQNGSINHATVFTTNTGAIAFNKVLWPAASTGGGCDAATCPNAMPMGARLRLKSSFNAAAVCNSGISKQDAACNTMLTALKQYGMILCDTGLANAVQIMSDVTEDPSTTAAIQQLSHAKIAFTNFEGVDESSLEISANSYQVCPLGKACLNGTNSYVAPSDQAMVTALSSTGAQTSTSIGIQGVAIGLGIPQTVAIAAGAYSYQIPSWVNGAADQTVTWSLLSGPGSLTSGGLYTPPSSTSGAGVVESAILQGVSNADKAATIVLRLSILPSASNGAVRIDTGSLSSTTDASGNVWTPDIGVEGSTGSVSSDYPHWNKTTPAATIAYESLQKGADVGNTIIVPNGVYNLHLLFGMPDAGNCSVCTNWLLTGFWNQYTLAPYILESQGQVQNSTFDFGALSSYLFQTPVDAYVPATVTNNILQVYVRSAMSDQPPYSVPVNSNKIAFLNGLEILPTSTVTTNPPTSSTAPAGSWTVNTNGQSTISPGQTLQPFSVTTTGGAPNDPKWSILSGPVGASLNGSTLSLSASSATGQAIVVQASDASYSATASIATVSVIPKIVTNVFSYHRTLTIAHHSVGASDLTNFPLAVSIVDPALANQAYGGHVTNANGYDIVVASDSAGKNLLNWEVERYDSATGTWVAHVQIPTLSHTVDTVIYLLYGNVAITSQQVNGSQAWDSGYSGVYHFEGPPLSVADSTSNANSASQTNLTYTSAGLIGGAATGTNASAALPAALLDQPSGTFETWALTSQAEDKSHTWILLSQAGSTKSDYFRLGWSAADNAFDAVWSSAKNGVSRLAFTATQAQIASHGWSHIVYTWNSAANLQSIYLNGVLLGSLSAKVPVLSSSNAIQLGSNSPSGFNSIIGSLDETRFSNVVRSSDWIAAEYSNQISASKFVSLGAEAANNN